MSMYDGHNDCKDCYSICIIFASRRKVRKAVETHAGYRIDNDHLVDTMIKTEQRLLLKRVILTKE
ncbi:MAG: hypothetical protein RO469_04365 [Thermincola sp.]|nr:hypothetical protein [Thermincola sp.]